MSMELILGIVTLFGAAMIGMPVAYAIITGVIVYLGYSGQDLAIAGEAMEIGRAHVRTPVTEKSRMPSSA